MKNIIIGLEAESISPAKRRLIKNIKPMGVILFARNCKEKEQVRNLVREIKSINPEHNTLILIDQEGGRVRRLRPSSFRDAPYSHQDLIVAKDPEVATFLHYYLISRELSSIGIDVNCAPVADLLFCDADQVIGDRSFSRDVNTTVLLSKCAAYGMHLASVCSVLKHIPGHGRASVDSHHALPLIRANKRELEDSDFKVFKMLANDFDFAMTAHATYDCIDSQNPATLSYSAISYIRRVIGYRGLIMTDDIMMGALSGDASTRAQDAIKAGCDIVLYCGFDEDQIYAIAQKCGVICNDVAFGLFNLKQRFVVSNIPKKFHQFAKKSNDELEKQLSSIMKEGS